MRTLRDIIVYAVAASAFIWGILTITGGAITIWDARHADQWQDLILAAGANDVGIGLLITSAGVLVALLNELVDRNDPSTD